MVESWMDSGTYIRRRRGRCSALWQWIIDEGKSINAVMVSEE
jgi:hypothetical protein